MYHIVGLFGLLLGLPTMFGFVVGPGGLRPYQLTLHSQSVMAQYLESQKALERDRREAKAKMEYEYELEKLISGNGANSKLLDPNFWMSLSQGGLTVGQPTTVGDADYQRVVNDSGNNLPATGEHLRKRGFCMVPNMDWSRLGVQVSDLARTMAHLKANGWPPVFIFMYDQPWTICRALLNAMAPVLGDANIALEASVFGWALDKPILEEQGAQKKLEGQEGPKEKVGDNFGMPHRDLSFENCHLPDGTPSIVSIWVPMTDATTDNGCMYCIPREDDPYFDQYQNREAHLAPFKYGFPYQRVTPLPAGAGTAIAWNPNTIHWGTSCSPYAADDSRKSIAFAVRLPEYRLPSTDKELQMYGRGPFTRQELDGGLNMHQRLKMCAQALLMYSVWFPEFDGFDKTALE